MGFTEWTNVGKAQKLFWNHYQPKVPADLGYYDLRYPEIRQQQAELAKKSGIEGFCYYHYWFGNGKQELEYPLQQIVELKEPDFPFCICWANQSWYSKFWNNDIAASPKLIAEQQYDNDEGIKKHFYSLLSAFKDDRYIKIDGKLVFMIYRPLEYPDVKNFMAIWQSLARQHNLSAFHFVGQAVSDSDTNKILQLGFDAVNIVRKDDFLKQPRYSNIVSRTLKKAQRTFGFHPITTTMLKYQNIFIGGVETNENVYPTLIPNWDHSPRSGKRAVVFTNSTPDNFKKHALDVIDVVKNKNNKIVFLKSWNEWGEGNYMEPDLKYGHGYIDALRQVLSEASTL